MDRPKYSPHQQPLGLHRMHRLGSEGDSFSGLEVSEAQSERHRSRWMNLHEWNQIDISELAGV